MKDIQFIDKDLFAPQDSWDRLSMTEKADMIKAAVKNGIYNLKDIRAKYNEFAEGGDTDWSYNSWKRQIVEHMGIRPDEDNTYDYEAYFKKYPEEAWRMLKGDPTAHFSDEFKTVYHPTFSSKSVGNDGSIYSGVRNPKTNPQGLMGGTWSPDYHTFTMSPDGYRGPVGMDDRKWYLENAEDNGVQLREADGSLPIYDGIPWGGVLPNVTIYGNKYSLGGPLVEAAMNEYKNGGGIHIKPSHRGRLTELKKRTGKTEAELYNDGNPAHKKMVVFARNSRKWHGEGGNLFSGEEEGSQKMQMGLKVTNDWKPYTLDDILANAARIEQQNQAMEDRLNNVFTLSNDATSVANGRPQNTHLERRAVEGAKQHAAWEKEHPILNTVGLGLSTIPFVAAASPILAPVGEAFAGTTLAGISAPMWTDAALTAGFGAHGLDHVINEGIDGWGDAAMTALEVAPLGRVISPMYQAGKTLVNPIIENEGLSISRAKTASEQGSIIQQAFDRNSQSVGDIITRMRRDATISKYANNQRNPVEQLRERMSNPDYAAKIRSHADPIYTSGEDPVYFEGYDPNNPQTWKGILQDAYKWWNTHPDALSKYTAMRKHKPYLTDDAADVINSVYMENLKVGEPSQINMSPHALIPNEETVFSWPIFKGPSRDGAAKQLQYNIIKSHEGAHAYIVPKEVSPLDPYIDTSTSVGKYLAKKNNSELLPRGSQIKSYYGKDSISEEELRYAADHYVEDTGVDNNMNDMFDIIRKAEKSDPDIWRKMAEYFTEQAAVLGTGIYLTKE